MRDLARIDHAGDKDWRSLAWKLERRHPAEFADRSRQGGDVNFNFNTARIIASPEWLQLSERLLAALAPFPDALDAVVAELSRDQVVEGSAVELPELEA